MKAQLKNLIILAALLPAFAAAQKAPGYLGKRFSIEYNAFLFPSFFNPNSAEVDDSDYPNDVSASINLQHYLQGQWSFSKRASLIASVGYTNTNFVPRGYNAWGASYDYPKMTAMSYNLGLRLFTQHYAPLGKHVEFRIGMAQVKTHDFDYMVRMDDGSGVRDTMYTIEGSSMMRPTIAVAWGTNRVIKDMVVISYGFDINLFAGGFGYINSLATDGGRSELDLQQGNTPNNQEELRNLAAGRYAIQCAVNLRVGIGILL